MIKWELGKTYRITSKNKKHILMKKIYCKSDDYNQKIISDEAYRNGWVELVYDGVEEDSKSMNLYFGDGYDPKKGVDVWCFPLTDHFISDGVSGDFSLSDNISKEEKEKLSDLISENGIEIIEEMGWDLEDSEVWFYGDLNIEKQ